MAITINHSRFYLYLKMIGIVSVPIIFLLLPANYFDKGKTICLITNLTGYSCPGCGITKAIQHAIHLDFNIAYSYNKLVIIVLPIIAFGLIKEFLTIFNKIKNTK
jgi:Protein of unknown function (DUF2752)